MRFPTLAIFVQIAEVRALFLGDATLLAFGFLKGVILSLLFFFSFLELSHLLLECCLCVFVMVFFSSSYGLVLSILSSLRSLFSSLVRQIRFFVLVLLLVAVFLFVLLWFDCLEY